MNSYNKNSLKIYFVLILSFLTLTISGQNIKKVYKSLEKDDLTSAVTELKKFDSKEKHDKKELLLIQLSTCIILSHENSTSFNPYEAVKVFDALSISNLESNEIDDYLDKYELSINKISDLVFKGVLIDAKKSDSEDSYNRALEVCKSCKYSSELKSLKIKSAYNECKKKDNVDAYKYFIDQYGDNEFKNEVKELLQKRAFENAKNEMTTESMDFFISNYANKEYKKLAVEIRDSLALPNKRDYKSLLRYSKLYPNSRFTPNIIKELPDVLYNESMKNNTVDDLKKFLHDFPNDLRINEAKQQLEKTYFYSLKKNFSQKGLNDFKTLFPNSLFINELNSLNAKLFEKSDLTKEGLKGNIKNIETTILDVVHNKYTNISREFNEFGKIKTFNSNWDFSDKIEDFEMSYMPKEFEDEFLIVLPFGRTKGTLHVGNKKEFGFGGATELSFEYNLEGNLVRVDDKEFKYDSNGNLIEKIFKNKSTPGGYSPSVDGWAINKIKYKWLDGKLISKYEYNDKGDRYDEFYDIEYKGNQQIIKAYTYSKDEPNTIITITKNTDGQITNKTQVDYGNYAQAKGVDVWPKYSNNYIYSNGYIIQIGDKVKVSRDTHGNIVYIDIDNYGRNQFTHDTEWSYEYDNYGNWVKRTEYNVKNGDIKISKKTYVVTRTITYY